MGAGGNVMAQPLAFLLYINAGTCEVVNSGFLLPFVLYCPLQRQRAGAMIGGPIGDTEGCPTMISATTNSFYQ